jgi:long-chain acyl-CoA synthetase
MLHHSCFHHSFLAHERRLVTSDQDVSLCFLPLSHVFERTGHNFMLLVGVSVFYAESVEKVAENMVEVRPTLMLSVPRLYEKMYARVHERVAASSPLRRRLFRWAVDVGRAAFLKRQSGELPSLLGRAAALVADLLVLKKIRARTGGRVKLLVSGGAPLAREIAEFLGAAGLNVCEGYGLTETSPVITANRLGRIRPGTVGLPFPNVEVKIAEDGEVLTRGPHVMKGYFKRPEATAEALDADGWFRTGDVGFQDADGFLVITDRKKDIIVTSGGKNIAPQPIENRLKTNRFVSEVVMIGNKRNFASALVVPNFDVLSEWAQAKGIVTKDREELVKRPEVVAHYLALVDEMTPELAQFERIKKVALLTREFSLEQGEITPTLKVKRRVVEERYKGQIDALYSGD